MNILTNMIYSNEKMMTELEFSQSYQYPSVQLINFNCIQRASSQNQAEGAFRLRLS